MDFKVPGPETSDLSKLPAIARSLVELWKDFVITATQVTIIAGASSQILDENPFRTFVGFYYSGTNTARIGIENPQTINTGMELSATIPTREFFIEREKKLSTSAWFGFGASGNSIVNIYQTFWRGRE